MIANSISTAKSSKHYYFSNITFLKPYSIVRYHAFDVVPTTVQVTPQTAAGSKVATISILINEKFLNNTQSFKIHISSSGTTHNNSERSLHYYHNTHPLFKIEPSNSSSNLAYHSSIYDSYYNSTVVAELKESSPVYCTVNSHNYIAISFDVLLQRNSLYHLGDHLFVTVLEVTALNS